ncbi:peptidase [Flavobacterium subsaxonicum WB 4.1-42 = DSM 21790]|uniref:Peptidase n=1 Tax=Flavobacterium subsaxonicum WB 4.1-42 = DSM 21790 TaxID=1121898 RepID=A0A0A2MQX3_9FLAO|nr:peptidase [Flavobacterium subsaxonicum WB 4.1-42 = DSM 21790]
MACIALLCSSNVRAQNIYKEDFLEFWEDYNANYAYFEGSGIDWNKAKEIYLPAIDTIKNNYQFTCLLEQVVNEFHNGHISLNTNYTTSNRIIPSGADVFAEKKGDLYYITDVRIASKAEKSGLKPGMEIVLFNGKPIDIQLQKFLPKSAISYTPVMYEYALNMLLAGTYDKKREFTIKENGALKTIYPDDFEVSATTDLLEYKILDGNIGYIKINNTLGDNNLITAFDKAFDILMQTKGIILDLTETPGGGNTTVARGIMGRFTDKELPYQKHVINEKEFGTVRSWVEYVTPRKTTYKNKVVIMVGHWTGSMGEGMAIGFDAMKRAKITGTKMAGLIGAIHTFSMKNIKIGYQIPIEKMYHVNGTPREDYLPQYFTKNSTETFTKALELIK